ncbi:MAG: hypothetical protein ABSG11_10795 [Candidatus Korobacteraceae bacterium]
MTETDYGNALSAAEKELAALTAQIELLEKRRAQLEQTVSALKVLTDVSQDEERTLTETIKIVVRGANDYISGADVLKAVTAMGAKVGGNAMGTVATILGRLYKDGILERHPFKSGMYRWKRTTTLGEVINSAAKVRKI